MVDILQHEKKRKVEQHDTRIGGVRGQRSDSTVPGERGWKSKKALSAPHARPADAAWPCCRYKSLVSGLEENRDTIGIGVSGREEKEDRRGAARE